VLRPPPGTVCRRQPVALELTVGDRPFGQVTEALVTLSGARGSEGRHGNHSTSMVTLTTVLTLAVTSCFDLV
jgi:hypothetical protein